MLPGGERRHDHGGLKCLASERLRDDLPGQIEDVTTFLERHQAALASLLGRGDVDDAYLDFAVDCRLARPGVAVQIDCLPPKLLLLAGRLGIGIMLSTYPASER